MSSDTEAGLTKERVEEIIGSGGSAADAMGFDEKDVEVLYNLGYTEYQQQKYAEAAITFSFLCQVEHRDARFWMGLGGAWQMLQNYPGAAAAYSMAADCDPPDPKAPLHGAECLLALGQVEEALDALDQAIDWAPATDEPQATLDRIRVLYEAAETFTAKWENGEIGLEEDQSDSELASAVGAESN